MSLEKEKTQVELANERGYKLPDFASFKPPKVMSGGHRETVKALAWSSDSRKLASCAYSSWGGENESFVRVWTPERSLDVRAATELNGHEKAVSSLDWDPVQPERLASAALDRTLKLWDIRSHTATSSLEFQRGLLSTAFHPSGNYIATSDMEDTVTLVDTRMNKILGLILEAGRVPSNFVHDKKKQVLSNNNQSNEATSNIKGAGNRKGAKVVNPYLPLENKEELNKIKFSNDGSLFCMATSSGKVRMLDSRNLDFSHNSDQAETKQKQDQTMEVDKEPGEREKERNEWKDYIPWELAMDFRAHSANVFNLEFDNGGRYMVTSSAESTIGIWDTKEFMSVALNPDMEVTARDMSLSYDGEVIAAGGDGRQIFLISTTTGKTIHKIPIWGAKVTALAWHPSRYLLAYAGEEPGMIKLFGLDR